MKTKEIEIQIMGKNFNFNLPENLKTDDFLEIIEYVENKYKKIKGEAINLDSFKLGLLVSINITEEFFALKRENEKLRVSLSKIDKMISPIGDDDQISISFSS